MNRRGWMLGMLVAVLCVTTACGGNETQPSGGDVSQVIGQETSNQPEEPSTSQEPETTTPVGGLVAESTPVEDSYFDDSVFLGDSVSLKLNQYVTAQREAGQTVLGQAQFLTVGSMGSGNALKEVSADSLHPEYNGVKTRLEDITAAMGAGKIYVMYGMNDIGLYGVEGSIDDMKTFLEQLQAKNPDAMLLVQSATPMVAESQLKVLNNENLQLYDQMLLELCEENQWYFVDVASAFRDEQGALPREYCSDPDAMGIHFTDAACQKWIEYLKCHTPDVE
jgi:lysophospholipase L1-like esterase